MAKRGSKGIPYLDDIDDAVRPQLRRFFQNNSHLLKEHGLSYKDQLKYFKERGIRLNKPTIWKLMNGETVRCNLTYLQFFSEYWEQPISFLLDNDLTA